MASVSRDQMEIELEFLTHLKETDRSHLPAALQSLEKGHLTFVKKEFLAFVREVDFKHSLKKYKTNFCPFQCL